MQTSYTNTNYIPFAKNSAINQTNTFGSSSTQLNNKIDTFLNSNSDNKKKKILTWGLTLSAIALGIVFFIKFHKPSKIKTPHSPTEELPKKNSSTTDPNVTNTTNTKVSHFEQFTDLQQAKEFFQKHFGIQTISFSQDTKLANLETTRQTLQDLKNQGFNNMPQSLTFFPFDDQAKWRLESRIKNIDLAAFQDFNNYYGLSSGEHILFNSNKTLTDHIVRHEMGHHLHRYRLKNHYENYEQIQSQDPCNTITNIMHLSNSSNRRPYYPHYQFLTKMYKNDIKQEVDLHDLDEGAHEVVAETFNNLSQGKRFSPKMMLIYDICCGPEFPKMSIDNKPYREYLNSLYGQAREILPKVFQRN